MKSPGASDNSLRALEGRRTGTPSVALSGLEEFSTPTTRWFPPPA